MQPLLNIAMRAARRAGDLIVKSLSRLDSLKIDSKGRNDFVTDIDRKAEADIIATIRRSHPQHAVLAEESGRSGNDETIWIIDPLDGTTNFLHGFPTFAVSIAVEHKGRLQHAVVYDPMRQEFFTASRGDGAQLEGKKIRVSGQRTLEGALIGTGYPFREGENYVDEYLAMLKHDGTLVQVGAPEKPLPVSVFHLIFKRRNFAGSLIGGIAETQEMLDFCADHGLGCDIEMIRIQQINEAYERLLKSDVKYRFVIDMASIKDAA